MKHSAPLFALVVALFAGSAQAADAPKSYPIDHVLGKADAPITIIEYASTTCGHCANFHKTSLPKIQAEWLDTGKAKLIYRDFPTAPGGLSVGASMIAQCAGPERYFGVLGLIMDKQDVWMGAENPLDSLKKVVRLAGLTSDDVDACLAKSDLANAIQARAKDANTQLGVEATPTFVIEGKVIEGDRPDAIESALKAASK